MEGEPTLYERYRSIADEIAKENALVSDRIRWMLQSETILFGGLALAVSGRSEIDRHVDVINRLLTVVPFLGIAIAISALLAINSGHLQLKHLKEEWHAKTDLHVFSRPFRYPKPEANRFTKVLVRSSTGFARVLPFAFTSVWVSVIFA